MTTKRAIIGYIIAYILSEIIIFVSVLVRCLCDGWHRFVDFAWWQIGIPLFALIVYVIMTFFGYLLIEKR